MTDLEKFNSLFDYGHKRKYKNGIEIRVRNLDDAFWHAKNIVDNNKLSLRIERDPVLRAVHVFPN